MMPWIFTDNSKKQGNEGKFSLVNFKYFLVHLHPALLLWTQKAFITLSEISYFPATSVQDCLERRC